jgi:hypothetical protein
MAVLRNLIDIFHKSFCVAEWDTGVFPSWAKDQNRDFPNSQVIN